MREEQIRLLCGLMKVEMIYESPNGELTAFFETISESPLMHSSGLRNLLRQGIAAQAVPFLHRSSYDCWFAAMRADDGFLYMGPMPHHRLTPSRRREMYSAYGIDSEDRAKLRVFTLPEIENMIRLTHSMLGNADSDSELQLTLNLMPGENPTQTRQEQAHYVLREEEQDDASSYRHGYGEEKLLMRAIREGRGEDAVRLAQDMDADVGRLSDDYQRHRLNLAIIGIALCARAAIAGGVNPETAYRVSGYYICKCDAAQDTTHMLHYRNRALEELAGRVVERQTKSVGSRHVARVQAYVKKHYRESLRLQDIADALSISPTYISRLFHQETGTCLQDYITRVRVDRAAELLRYSQLSVSEIAVYVNFPNQSYFTRVFRKYRGITPFAYRNQQMDPH